jgi:hydroxyethylthiazole kinase-like uncharacterized protein yjeF
MVSAKLARMMKSMPLLLRSRIKAIEDWARAQSPALPLMERAGKATAELVQQVIDARSRRVLVLAGPGNNGGDGLVAARMLKNAWFDVRVVWTGSEDRLPADSRAALLAWREAGGTVAAAIPEGWDWHLAVDGLFGIGLTRPLDARHAELVSAIHSRGWPIVSIDVPSGLDADTGRTHGVAVRADHTVTFLAGKPGLYTADGPDHCGDVHLDRLGTEAAPLPQDAGWLIGDEIIAGALSPRARNSHKGIYGDVVILGGAPGMVGAALLAGRAALKLGAGRVLVGLLADEPKVDILQPDLMLRPAEEVLKRLQIGCAVIGPGLGQSAVARQLLDQALALDTPVVIDADALNLLAADSGLRKTVIARVAPTLLTPHPAEAARLLDVTTDQVQGDRVRAARALAKELRAHAVLKGAGSICTTPNGNWSINGSGNPGMASAGMGDVLSGILGALLAQAAAPYNALMAGVRVHGLAADELVLRGVGPVGLTASETIDAARSVWNRLAQQDGKRTRDPAR